MQKQNRPLSFVELSKKNFKHNAQSFRALLHRNTKIVFAIKGNAYGHGQNEIARIAEPYVDYFLVNSLEELRLLRKISKKPVLVLGYVSPAHLPEAIGHGCILGVFSEAYFREIEKVARRLKKKQEVHIAVDALLGREGFLENELVPFLTAVKNVTSVRITGMYAHFANIEDTENFSHAKKQIASYEHMKERALGCGYTNLMTHISATSGLLAYEKDLGTNALVRIGIGMYGLWPSESLRKKYSGKLSLRPVLSWKTHVAQVKILSKGSTVGYGLTYVTKKQTKIALIPQGYSDGFPRNLSNKGCVLIGGKRCLVLGRVSMNMFVVDVSRLKNVREGDEVVLLGTQGKERLSAEELAELSGTINYEVTTRISPLLPRVVE